MSTRALPVLAVALSTFIPASAAGPPAAAAPPAALTPLATPAAGAVPSLEQYQRLTLGESARKIGPLTVRNARLELEIRSGIAAPIMAGQVVVGVQFHGDGTWRYAVDDRQSLKTFQQNVQTLAPALQTSVNRIYDRFTRATILFAQPVYRELWEGEAATIPVPPDMRSALAEELSLLEFGWTPYAHRLAEAADAGTRWIQAEFDGGATRVGYSVEELREGLESLSIFRQFSGVERRHEQRLSHQALDGKTLYTTVLEHADLKVDTPDNRSGTISGTLRFRAVEDGARYIALDLDNHRDRSTEGWRAKKNLLTVTELTGADGRPLLFSHRCGEILVDLGAPIARGSLTELRFEESADIFTGLDGQRGDSYIGLWGVNWFPIPRRIEARRITFTLEARSRKPYRPVTTGEQIELVERDDHYVLRAKSDVPVWDIAFFAGKYKVAEIRDRDWTIRAFGYGIISRRNVDQLASVAAAFMQVYEAKLGPCAFNEIELVEVPVFERFGVSPPGLIMLTSTSFKSNDPLLYEYLGNSKVSALVAHELAHQWFGHSAWPADMEDNWLSESFAEYLAGLAMGTVVQAKKIDTAKLLDFEEMLARWRAWAKTGANDTIAGANHLAGDDAWTRRFHQLYDKGPLVLHMYRTLIGEERFNATLRRFLDDAKIGPTSTERFVKIAAEIAGQDVSWFFDQWIREPGIPEITVSHEVEGTTLRVVLAQSDKSPLKKIHVPLVVEYPGGQREVKLAFQTSYRQSFEFPLKGPPVRVVVDPRHNNLADYR